MTDITRNTFDESKGYRQVAFQRNRDVLDSELNELQDNIRVDLYRGRELLEKTLSSAGADEGPKLVFGASSSGVGNDFGAKSGTGTSLTLQAGEALIYGYKVKSASDIVLSGITNPSGATRVDTVWVALQEAWVDSAVDPNIAVGKLGETAQRRKLNVTFGVTQGGAAPASTGEPWMNLTTYVTLGKLYWNALTATTINAWVDMRQMGGALARGSMNNLFVQADKVSYDGTSVTVSGLTITDPYMGLLVSSAASFTVAVTAGDMLGWSGESGSRLRRTKATNSINVVDVGSNVGPNTSPIVKQTLGSATVVPNDSTYWLLHVTSKGVVMRDGTCVYPGDSLNNWRAGGEQVSCTTLTAAEANGNPYVKKYREAASGKVVNAVDYLGFMSSGFTFEMQEVLWNYGATELANSPSLPASSFPWAIAKDAGNFVGFGCGYASFPPSHFPTRSLLSANSGGGGAGSSVIYPNPRNTLASPILASAECLIVAEWIAGFSTASGVPATPKQTSFSFGLADLHTNTTFHPSSGLSGGLPADKDYWVFFCDLNGVWWAISQHASAGGSVQQLTGFAPVADKAHRFRLELVSAAYTGSGGEARFWIDDKLWATSSSGPYGNAVGTGPVMGIGCAGVATGTLSMYFGPMKVRFKATPQAT